MLATQDARKEVGATEAGAAVAGDLDLPPAEQRIAILDHRGYPLGFACGFVCLRVRLVGPDAKGFVGTAAPVTGITTGGRQSYTPSRAGKAAYFTLRPTSASRLPHPECHGMAALSHS